MRTKSDTMKRLSKVYNKRIDIITTGTVSNENGFGIEGEVLFKSLYASVNNLYGKEFWDAKTVKSEKTVVFTVRYSRDLESLDSEIHKIKFKNRYFNIIHIDNILYMNNEIKIKAVEVT